MADLKSISHSGWLVKKSQKRYYILYDGHLSWFTSYHEPVGDYLKDARGSIKLVNCSVGIFPDKRMYLFLSTPEEMYLMKARTDEEADEWFLHISKAIKAYSHQNDEDIPFAYNKAGTLVVNNQPKFIMMRNGIFTILNSEDDPTDKIELDLMSFSCIPGPSFSAFTLSSTDGSIQYEMSSPHGIHDTTLWGKTLLNQIFCAKNQLFAHEEEESTDVTLTGWLTIQKTGKKRFFVLLNTTLTYYADDPQKGNAVIEGSISLVGGTIAKPKSGPNLTFAIKDKIGNFMGVKGHTQQEADKWIAVLASVCKKSFQAALTDPIDTDAKIQNLEGWVDRKFVGKRRTNKVYLVLNVARGFSLKIYDNQNYATSKPEDDIYLAQCRCSRVDALTFSVAVGAADSHHFSTQTEEETRKWVSVMSRFIYSANNELQKALVKNEWLMQVSKGPRWVVISRQRQLMCFQSLVSPENIVTPMATTVIEIYGATVVKGTHQGKPSFTVTSNKGNVASFVVNGEESICQSWVDLINELALQRGEIKAKSLTFGVPLQDICDREGTDIPSIITRCIDFIGKNGTDQQGIFRLSGSSSEIKEYSDLLDEGKDINFSYSTDVHAVTGLLKSFLRRLPDPLLHSRLYPHFISTTDPQVLKALCVQLAPLNYRISQLLFTFLYRMAKYSDVTSMDSSNIAIVIGPNVLGNAQGDDLQKLQDTPAILCATKALIDECYTIFPSSEDHVD